MSNLEDKLKEKYGEPVVIPADYCESSCGTFHPNKPEIERWCIDNMDKETKHDDGGAAFPVSTIDNHTNEGMTLWDFFAAHAPVEMYPVNMMKRKELKSHIDSTSKCAADYADALLAERRKRFG